MVESQSRIEIPIEISPQDTREINVLLERIERAESQLFRLNEAAADLPEGGGAPGDIRNPMSEASHTNPRKRRSRVDTSDLAEGRSPVQTAETDDIESELGSIGFAGAFLLGRREEATPKGREVPLKTGGGAPIDIQNTSAFKKLKERVDKTDKFIEELNKGTGKASTIASFFSSPVGFITSVISEAAPIIAPILIAKGLMDLIIHELTKDGAPFDRRLKILIEKQVAKLMNRDVLKQIRAGQIEVRVTTSSTLRGVRGNQGDNLSIYTKGRPVYDMNLEQLSKGVIP